MNVLKYPTFVYSFIIITFKNFYSILLNVCEYIKADINPNLKEIIKLLKNRNIFHFIGKISPYKYVMYLQACMVGCLY